MIDLDGPPQDFEADSGWIELHPVDFPWRVFDDRLDHVIAYLTRRGDAESLLSAESRKMAIQLAVRESQREVEPGQYFVEYHCPRDGWTRDIPDDAVDGPSYPKEDHE